MKTYLVFLIIATNAAAIKTASDSRLAVAIFFGIAAVMAMVGLAHAIASDMFYKQAEENLEEPEDKPYLN